MVETWQADPDGGFDHPERPAGAAAIPGFRGFGRSHTVEPAGEYGIFTLKPGRVPDGEGGLQAPHVDVSVFARGLLDRVVTRIYFADEADGQRRGRRAGGAARRASRATLIAEPTDDGYVLDIHLQGWPKEQDETVFFAV